MIDQICVDSILQVTATVIWEQYIDRFGARITTGSDARGFGPRVICDGVVDAVNYVGMRRKESVSFNLLESLRYRFLAKRTTNLLQRIEVGIVRVLN